MSAESPMLPRPIPRKLLRDVTLQKFTKLCDVENTVCVAYSVDSWYRVMVLSTDEATDTSYVKFMDFGGYAYVENENLRQIRRDFIMLPFQAAECFLANVLPKSGKFSLVAMLILLNAEGFLLVVWIFAFTLTKHVKDH